MKDYVEKTIHREEIFRGKILDLVVDQVLLPNGRTSSREIVLHRGAVAVLAVTKDKRCIFVKQYRKAMEMELLEIPAGKLELGEDPLTCAKRELEEETGYTSSSWEEVHRFYSAPGFSNELVHLYKANNVEEGLKHPDEDEFVEVLSFTLAEALELISQGKIMDAKTLVAIYHWALSEG